MDNIWDVLKLMERFAVKGLKVYCGEFLTKHIKTENVLELLDKATDYDLEDFYGKCIMHMSIMENKKLFETEKFLKIKNQTLINILKSDELRGNEFELYKQVYNWAKNSCEENNIFVNSQQIRLALGEAFNYIRFGSMNCKEFSECVNENSILSSNETIQTFRSISDEKFECMFSSETRTKFGIKEFKVCEIERAVYGLSCYSINFIATKTICLHGVLIYGLNKADDGEFLIVLDSDKKKIISSKITKFAMDGSKKAYKLLFAKTIYLKPYVTYTIRCCGLAYNNVYHSIKPLNVNKTSNGIDFSFKTKDYSTFAGLIFE